MALVWFITGASNGLGLAISLNALKAGHHVIAAMRNPARSTEAVKAVEAAGGRVFQLDLTEPQESIAKKMREADAIHGKIDCLVNNAGYSVLGPFENFT
jgi:NAD(P)-dependent dehydrogenase (short-subunit alcohol dehydrogenase family)